jgi:GxxExxY protein
MAWTQRLKAEIARPHIPLMETIRRSAEVVMARHGSGCTEAMYQRALQIDLYHKNICSLAEVDCFCVSGCTPIYVGRLDLEIDHRVILELKVGPKITLSHIQQLKKYVRARVSTGMNVEAAAIIIFNERDRVEILELDIPRTKSPFFKLNGPDSAMETQ